ncbi:MAG: FAD binding domain-containing protein [Gaiellaceae bacterium]
MANVIGYERPETLVAALELLSIPGTVTLAGGTWLNAARTAESVVVVDMQAVSELDGIEELAGGRRLSIGATTSLQRLTEERRIPPAIREAARRELPSTLRAAASLGGCVAMGLPDSELLATLLVHEARIELLTADSASTERLDELLARGGPDGGQLITRVELETSGESTVARTARTPADRPIVAAAARRPPAGEPLLALTGVAERPLLVADVDEIEPLDDFRGSAEYRRHLAVVLAERALEAVS